MADFNPTHFDLADEKLVERAAIALYVELEAGALRYITHAESGWVYEDGSLTKAVRAVLAAANDPMWGKERA